MPKVYIVSDGGHDYSPAEEYGDVVFLSGGMYSRYAISQMFRDFNEKLQDSRPEDYLVPTGLTQMTQVATAILVHKHGCINLLIHEPERGTPGRYVERNLHLRD